MKVSLFYLPSVGSKADIEKGRVGLQGHLYDRMLHDITGQAKLADDLGYDSISFTEHHFHVEGFELSNNPVLLDLYIAMQTRRLRVGQLGIVLPSQNPLRVAEDIAMLDHMTGGRANAGFARGYQRRWVDIMAQQTHGIHGALPHQHDEIDNANRAAFEENFRIIKQAWTQDFLSYEGKYWRVPPGETPWTLDATAKWGGGVEKGIVRAVSVVPKPVQKPHPPIFQPFASSERSIRWCAQ
ncbi:MAG TPA: LLM class flavin-dependent oxidoreductase, partial [Sporolactobacillaceae bacterium]|nr:LLM class flavin-dependent oxidoreductase [Sporolactobacillaceae bacterium]